MKLFYFSDELTKIERGEQRIKKYQLHHATQRKLVDHGHSTTLSASTNSTNNSQIYNNNENKYVIEWTTKTSPITTITANRNQFIKEEVSLES